MQGRSVCTYRQVKNRTTEKPGVASKENLKKSTNVTLFVSRLWFAKINIYTVPAKNVCSDKAPARKGNNKIRRNSFIGQITTFMYN